MGDERAGARVGHGGAGDERTQDANVTAFDRWGLIPRMLVGAVPIALLALGVELILSLAERLLFAGRART